MTDVVAVTDGQRVVIGADSAAISDREIHIRATPKVFRNGPYAVGFTTSWRMGQILNHLVELPEPPRRLDDEQLERFMVTEVIETIRDAFTRHGFVKTARVALSSEITVEGQAMGGAFLIGIDGCIFEIREDFQVVRPGRRFAAVGAGAVLSLGALRALERLPDLSLEERTLAALEAAQDYSPAVRAPFRLVSTPE
ncbi:MAG: hypothetical protein V3T72_11805 [Thermoanaerobaculia bacterium]